MEKALAGLTDEKFAELMRRYEAGTDFIQVLVPNSAKAINMDDVFNLAAEMGHEFFEHLWLTDGATGLVSRTVKPAFLPILPERRQSQMRSHKAANASDNKHIDELTGQPTGDSKASSISQPQSLILDSRGLSNSALEFYKIRGGDAKAFDVSNRLIYDTGEVSMERLLELGTRAKSTETLSAYLTAQHLRNNA